MSITDSTPSQAETFLSSLFGGIPDDQCFYIWKLSSHMTFWHTKDQIHDAAAFARQQTNIYVGVSLLHKALARQKGERQRVTNNDSSGTVGLYSDIDFGTEGHKKPGNPPTVEDAMWVLDNAPLSPSLVVHSGNGLQAWWLFDQPWLFYAQDVRLEAANLSERWNKTISTVAAQHDWSVDSVYDLARVLRVPETFNEKPNAATKPVSLVYRSDRRYTLDQIVSVIPKVITPNNELNLEVVVDLHTEPALKKMMLLMDYDPKFHQSFYRSRTDDMKDKSNSGYDMSLASIAARAGWSDQEIVDLIIASRRESKAEVEDRVSYFKTTIKKARFVHNDEQVFMHVERTQDESGSIAEILDDRDEALKLLRAQLGIHITRVVRYVSNPPYRYAIVTMENGTVDLPNVDSLIVHNRLRSHLADLGTLIPNFRSDRWSKVAKLLLQVCEDEDAGETDFENLQGWLSDYLLANKPDDDVEQALKDRAPIRDEDGVWISSDDFRRWMILNSMELQHTRKTLGPALKSMGCDRRTKQFETNNGMIVRRSMWHLPLNMEYSKVQRVLESENG